MCPLVLLVNHTIAFLRTVKALKCCPNSAPQRGKKQQPSTQL